MKDNYFWLNAFYDTGVKNYIMFGSGETLPQIEFLDFKNLTREGQTCVKVSVLNS